MSKRTLLIMLIVTLLETSIYASNSPLDAYIQNLNSAGFEYAAGKISSDELLCKVIETEYLIRQDKKVNEFISSKDNSELKKRYEVVFNESDWKYRDENPVKKEVLDSVLSYKQVPIQMAVYYNLQGDKPLVIYITVQESRGKKSIDVDMYPAPYRRGTNEGTMFQQKCLEKYLKPISSDILENATQVIIFAKEGGIDAARAEEHLKISKDLFEKGNYRDSQMYALWAIKIIESSKKLKEYQSLSDDEKMRLAQEKFSHLPKEKMNRSTVISGEGIENLVGLGSNIQFNIFLSSESNSIFSVTEVININSRTVTIYQNQLLGEYDIYAGVDAKLLYEIMLMTDAKTSAFSYGKQIGIAVLKGEIKIKPYWKIYKILSVINALGGVGEEFTKGVTSVID